jgi:hypothetical protein
VAIFDARKIAAQKARTALDVALGEAAIAAVGADDFANIYFRFFFWHRGVSLETRGYLTSYP